MIEKQKYRRNSFAADYGAKDDDFILADLDLLREDEEEPSPVPLNHFMDDEDVIDRLLIGAHYNADNEPDVANDKTDALTIADMSIADELADIEVVPAEEDAIDKLLVNSGFDDKINLEEVDGKPDALEVDDISPADELDVNFDGYNARTIDQALSDSENSMLALEKEEASVLMVQEKYAEKVNPEQAKPELFFDSLNNPEKNELNLSGTEQANIKKLIKDYENKAKKAAVITYASLGIGFVALLSAVIMGVIVFGMQTKVAKLSDLVSILEEDMGSIAGKNSDLEINPSDASIEQLNQKLNGLPESLEEQTPSSTNISENEMAVDATKQASTNKSLDNSQIKPPALKNKKPSEAVVKKVSTEKTAGKAQTTAGWSVNLTAYEDQSYAKNKAAKFLQKGIPVKVVAVDMNNAKWYRLKVGGFKSKEEATAYAAKIKKSLNLNSVSVVAK